MEFPKIKGIKWLSEDYPDLICIQIVMENRAQAEMGLDNVEECTIDMYLDLSKLAGIKDWYEKGEDDPSTTECCVDFEGVTQMVLVVTKENLLKAWLFYKNFKYDSGNI